MINKFVLLSTAKCRSPFSVVLVFRESRVECCVHRDISDCSWSAVVCNVAVLEFLSDMVTSRGWEATQTHWDFVTISLCSLLASVQKSMSSWGSTKVPIDVIFLQK